VPLPEVPVDRASAAFAGAKGSSGTPPAIPEAGVSPEGPGLKIRVVTRSGVQNDKKKTGVGAKTGSEKIKETINIKKGQGGTQPDPYLPAGSILSGTLVTGLDVPTANQARKDPFPALLRVKHEAILPNRYRMDIRECFIVSSGYGDLSSERAYMRAESLSCVRKDGGVIDASLDAYVVGEDGKAGVRGRLVSKNGQLLANALLSGFILVRGVSLKSSKAPKSGNSDKGGGMNIYDAGRKAAMAVRNFGTGAATAFQDGGNNGYGKGHDHQSGRCPASAGDRHFAGAKRRPDAADQRQRTFCRDRKIPLDRYMERQGN
jgi:hypothetical protein